jgi:hypothetical protein
MNAPRSRTSILGSEQGPASLPLSVSCAGHVFAPPIRLFEVRASVWPTFADYPIHLRPMSAPALRSTPQVRRQPPCCAVQANRCCNATRIVHQNDVM